MSETEEANEVAKPNEELEANAESKECRECKSNERVKFIKEVLSLKKSLDYSRSVRANFYFVVVKLMMHSFKQQPRMATTERKLINHLRQRELSIGDITWILGRSKSSIHAVLNEHGEGSEPNEPNE